MIIVRGDDGDEGCAAGCVVVTLTSGFPSAPGGSSSAAACSSWEAVAFAIDWASAGFGSVAEISRVTVSRGLFTSIWPARALGLLARPSSSITAVITSSDRTTSTYDFTRCWAKSEPV